MATTGVIAKMYEAAYIKAKTIAAVNSNPDTYTDSGNGFVVAGFADDDEITVSGFTTGGNNGSKTIATVAAGTITLVGGDTLTDESAGDEVIIYKDAPGTLRAGIAQWTVNQTASVEDVTSYDDMVSATITADTIAFVDGGGSDDTITDSGNGFVSAGFVANKPILISGSTSNNYSATPSAVEAGVLTVPTGTVTAEIAGDTVTIKQFDPWRAFAATLNDWTASTDKLWLTTNDSGDFFGIPHMFRFFIQYYAIPQAAPLNAVYYEGVGIIDRIDTPMPVGMVIRQPFTIRGTGTLTLKSQTSAW